MEDAAAAGGGDREPSGRGSSGVVALMTWKIGEEVDGVAAAACASAADS